MISTFLIAALLLVVVSVGCSPTAPPPIEEAAEPVEASITEADVEMPATYSEAVARLRQYRDQIRDAVAAGTYSKAHRPLDELEIVVWKMPDIARASDVPRKHGETVVVSSEELSELFNKIHSAIDDHREPDYEAVAQPIEDAIERLESVE